MRLSNIGINLSAFLGIVLSLSSAGLTLGKDPLLPNRRLTPGDTLDVTRDDVCVPGYSRKIRDVPADLKAQVYAEYGIIHHRPRQYEVDHLISLELGGSNSIKNLWPQSYVTSPWNAHIKDRLEDHLHSMVCSGQLDLKVAQRAISQNWITAYRKYMGQSASGGSAHSSPRFGSGADLRSRLWGGLRQVRNAKVWVNTRSGKYFPPGSRYYGKTKQGQYMREKDAIQQGYQAAKE